MNTSKIRNKKLYQRLFAKENELISKMDPADWLNMEKIKELSEIQKERAKEGRKLDKGIIKGQ